MALKDRLLRLEKILSLGDEKHKTCVVAYDWPNDDGTFEHVEIRMTPAKFKKYCADAERIYGSHAEPADLPARQ
jgi:hypothetical protein